MPAIAIGDIHGNLAALDDLLGRLTPGLGGEDTVVFLGDYIDRGPDSRRCIDRILELRSTGPAKVVTLIGNHEDWLLRTLRDPTRHSWILGMEAFPTIASYSGAVADQLRCAIAELGPAVVTDRVKLPYEAFIDVLPAAHLEFFSGLEPYCRIDRTVFVHGGLGSAGGPVEQQPRQTLLWGPDDFPASYGGSDLVVYGHRDNAVVDANGWPLPRFSSSTIGLDTISHGVLTAIELPGGRIVQSARHAV